MRLITQNLLRLATKALVVLVLMTATVTIAAAAQQKEVREPIPKPSEKGMSSESTKDDDKEPFSAVEEEMRAKRAIKEADREYQENLGRARDLSSLGVSIVTSFKQKNGLDQEDIKKLEKVERLAKGIRRAAGGSEDNVEMEKPPKDLAAAMEMLGDLSQSLKAKVEKTPKHVVSAAVIDEANVLLELIRIVRTLPAKV